MTFWNTLASLALAIISPPLLILMGVGFGNMWCYEVAMVAAKYLDNVTGL